MTDQTSSIQTHPVEADTSIHLPRITIHYCTQCKWMLRAAYVCPYLNRRNCPLANPQLILVTMENFTK